MSRVLLVIGPATGGMGSHVAGLATGLPGLGWTVTVFTSPRTAERFALGDRVVTGWPASPAQLPARLRALRALIKGADVVHAHGHQAGLLTVLAARTLPRRRRPPVVITWHNAVLHHGPKRQVFAVAEALQARGADLVTGASADLVDRARQLGSRTARLSEVAAAAVKASTSKSEKDPAQQTILTVSRIAPQKRLDVLVDAAATLHERRPDVQWLVAGDGDTDLLAQLQERAEARNAPVTWLGHRNDVPALMAAADVFALPSAWEARALVVQEAMAAGLPVVATAVGGVPDLLGDTGLLVPPGDADALVGALERLLADRVLAAGLARAARDRFASLPTEADVVADWSQQYHRLTRPE
jgi:glycosyltransferase involved in cell wall biosynthesis